MVGWLKKKFILDCHKVTNVIVDTCTTIHPIKKTKVTYSMKIPPTQTCSNIILSTVVCC